MDRTDATSIATLLVLALSSFLTGCVTSPEARTAEVERHAARAASELSKRTDADSLAAAGVLSRGGVLSADRHSDRSLPLLAQAAAAAPERPELVWLQAEACQEAPPCDPEPFERRLRVLDPSNGVGWMVSLARADAAKNDPETETALLAISRSDRVDIYWTTLIAHLSRAAAQSGKISLADAETLIIGYLAAQAIPAYGAASRACKGERLQSSNNVLVCRGVAQAFQRGDTFITEMIGVAIAKRVWPEDSTEYKAAVESRHVYEYRSDKFAKSDLTIMSKPDWADRYLALCEQNLREQDVFQAELIAAGVDPNPPQ